MLWTHVAACRGRHADSPARTQAEAARLFKQVKDAYEVLSDGAPRPLWTDAAVRVLAAVARSSSAVPTVSAALCSNKQQCLRLSRQLVRCRFGLQARRGACTTPAGARARGALHLGPARRRVGPRATAARTAAATATPSPAAAASARRARAPAGPTSATSSASTTGTVRGRLLCRTLACLSFKWSCVHLEK